LKTYFPFKRYLIEVVVKSLAALGRLYQLQTFALPRFVLGASPFVAPGDAPLLDVLRQVTVQHEHKASQLADAILLRGGALPKSTYPSRYTSLHDVALRYLLTAILEEQRAVVRRVEELAHYCRDDKLAQRLAQQVRRNETAHLRLFEELCMRYPIDGRLRHGEWQTDAELQLDSRRSKGTSASVASRHADRAAQVAA